jgi:hypothetical protein
MAYYNPYKDDREEKRNTSSGWFMSTGIKAGLLGLNAFAIYGMYKKARGPWVTAMNNMAERRTKEIIQREYKKTSIEWELEAGNQRIRDLNILTTRLTAAATTADIVKPPSHTVLASIDHVESTLAHRGGILDPTIRHKDVGPAIGKDAVLQQEVSSIFSRLKLESIRDYIRHHSPEGGEALYDQLTTYSEDFGANREVIDNIHRKYLEEDASYCSTYLNKLRKMNAMHFLSPAGIHRSVEDIQKSIKNKINNYYTTMFKESVTKLPESMTGFEKIDSQDLLKEQNWNIPRYTAATGTFKPKSELLQIPLAIRYDKDFQMLIKKLNEIKALPNSTIKDYELIFDTYSRDFSSNNTSSYVTLRIMPTTPTGKGVIETRIPVTKDTRMPGMNISSPEKIDMLHIVRDNFGSVQENREAINGTQRIIHNIIKVFNSPSILNEIEAKASNVQDRLNYSISSVVNSLPNSSFELRDHLVKALGVQFPWINDLLIAKNKPTTRAKYKHALESIKVMKTLNKNKRGSVVIAIDFEAMSPSNIGVQHTPHDVDTQVYKAGIVTMDMKSGKVLEKYNHEMTSVHGLDALKNKITPEMKKLVARWMNITDENDAWKAFDEKLRQENASIGTGAKDNKQFLTEVYNRISAAKAALEAEGKEVFFVFKNGWQYDIKFLQQVSNFSYENKNKILDVQNLAAVRAIGSSSDESLAMENMMKSMFGDFHGISHGEVENLTKGNVKGLFELLTQSHKSTGNKLVDMQAPEIEKFGAQLHLSPKTDSLLTLALLRFEHFKFLNNEDLYGEVEHLIDMLSLGNGPTNAMDMIKLIKSITASPLHGYKIGFSGTSHGHRSNLKASLLHQADLLGGLADIDYARQSEQVHRGYPMGPSQKYMKRSQRRTGSTWNAVKKYTSPIATTAVMDVENNMKASTNANYFSNTVVADTIALVGTGYGRETFVSYDSNFIRGMHSESYQTVRLTLDQMNDDSVTNNQVMRFYDLVQQKAKEIQIKTGQTDMKAVWKSANEAIANDQQFEGVWALQPGARSPGQNGSIKHFKGKIMHVQVDRGKVDRAGNTEPSLIANILRYADEEDFHGHPITAAAGAFKSMVGFSKGLSKAYSVDNKHGVQAISTFDALNKGFIGWFKTGYMNRVTRHWQEMLNDPKTSKKDKVKARWNLRKIARELQGSIQSSDNGHGRIILNEAHKRPMLKFKNLDSAQSEIAQAYLGGVDMSLSRVGYYMEQAGFTHNAESAKRWNENMQTNEQNAKSLAGFKEIINGLTKGTIDKKYDPYGYFSSLTEEGKAACVEDLQYMMSSVGKIQAKKNGQYGAAFLEMMGVRDSAGKVSYAPGARILTAAAWSNMDNGLNARNTTAKIQASYLADIFTNSVESHSTFQYINNNLNLKTNRKMAKAFKSMIVMRDQVLSNALIKSEVNLDQLNMIFPPDRALDDNHIKKTIHGNGPLTNGAEIRAEADEILNKTPVQKQAEINAQQEAINISTNNIKTPVRKGLNSIYTESEAHAIQRQLKEHSVHGILNVSAKSATGGALVIPIRETVSRMGDVLPGIAENIEKQDAVIAMFMDAKSKSGKSFNDSNAWFDITKGENNEMLLHLRSVPLYFGSSVDANFDSFKADGNKFNKDSKSGMAVVLAFQKYYDMLNTKDQRIDNPSPNEFTQEERLRKTVLGYFMSGPMAGKDSRNFNMSQMHVKGTMAFHDNYERIASTIVNLGNTSDEFLKKHGISSGDHFRSFSKKLLSQRRDTLYMTESLFKQTLQGQVADSFTSVRSIINDAKDAHLNKVLDGDEMLQGGLFTRFPMTQSGADALQQAQIQVIPDKYSKILGVNNNTFYAHAIHSRKIGADNDADQVVVMLKLDSILKNYNGLKAEQEKDFAELMKRPDVAKDMSSFSVIPTKGKLAIGGDVAIYGFSNGKVKVSGYDSGGMHIVKELDLSQIETGPIMDKLAGVTAKASAYMANNITSDMTSLIQRGEESVQIMKSMVGYATNIAKARALTAMRVGLRKAGSIDPLVATLENDFSGFSQQIIESAKHINGAAEAANAIDFMNDPLRHADKRSSALKLWLDSARGSVGDDAWNGKVGDTNITLAETQTIKFDLMMGKVSSIAQAEKHSKAFKILNKSINDVVMGKASASWADMVISNSNGMDPRVNEAFENENGYFKPAIDVDTVFKIDSKVNEFTGAAFKKGSMGKYAAIGAIAFLGLNLFRPNQMSSSMNPLDAFIDIGKGPTGDINALSSDVELDRKIPLDTINASFSRDAFIKLNNTTGGQENKIKSSILQSMMANAFDQIGQSVMTITDTPQVNYSNYTSFVGNFGTTTTRNRVRS